MEMSNMWAGSKPTRRYRLLASGSSEVSHHCSMRYWLMLQSDEVRVKAIKVVEKLGPDYFKCFVDVLRPTLPRVSHSIIPPANPLMAPRDRSRSPVFSEGATDSEFAGVDFCGRRVAKDFGGKIYFGTVAERIQGAVLAAPDAKGIRLWQAVWKIEYDDGDAE